MIQIKPVESENDLKAVTDLANIIWHQYFTPIIGEAQVNYMVDKFQSYEAVGTQLKEGYEYFMLYCDDTLAGYTGIKVSADDLFLSKLYIHENFRSLGIGRETFHFLVNLCKERNLSKIWLTCNRHNAATLDVYNHLGFSIIEEKVADIGNGYVMDDYVLEYRINKQEDVLCTK